jgi:hypothetical protein
MKRKMLGPLFSLGLIFAVSVQVHTASAQTDTVDICETMVRCDLSKPPSPAPSAKTPRKPAKVRPPGERRAIHVPIGSSPSTDRTDSSEALSVMAQQVTAARDRGVSEARVLEIARHTAGWDEAFAPLIRGTYSNAKLTPDSARALMSAACREHGRR